jgi:hypothetical protein
MIRAMNRTPIAVCALFGLAAAFPGAAPAAVLRTDKPCYIEQTPMTVRGSGYTANTRISVSGDQLFADARTDGDGAFSTTLKAPIFPTVAPGSRRYTVSAAEQDDAATSASVTFRVANFAFATTAGYKSPKTRRRWTFSGFRAGRTIYGHFRFKGRTRGTYRFGVANSPCGELTRTAAGIPVRGRIPAGKWIVQVDQSPRYSALTKPALRATTTVAVVR